jgi:hypothetical protein
MFEDLTDQFRRLVKEAKTQDAILQDLAKQRDGVVWGPGFTTLKALFGEARALRNDVPEYSVHGNPAANRSQLARLIAKLEDAIEHLELDELAYSNRNELQVAKTKALDLLEARRLEGQALQNAETNEVESSELEWSQNVVRTLRRVFATPWNANKFEELIREHRTDGRFVSLGLN